SGRYPASAVCDERRVGGGLAQSRTGAIGRGGSQPGRDSGVGCCWHFIFGGRRAGRGAAQPAVAAPERQRRDGGGGGCGRGGWRGGGGRGGGGGGARGGGGS